MQKSIFDTNFFLMGSLIVKVRGDYDEFEATYEQKMTGADKHTNKTDIHIDGQTDRPSKYGNLIFLVYMVVQVFCTRR